MLDVFFAVSHDLNFRSIVTLIILFKMKSNYSINNQIFTNSTIDTVRCNEDAECVSQVGGSGNINDRLQITLAKQSIIPTGVPHVNHLNDNGLQFGSDQLTLTNYHVSLYGELLFTVEINKIVHWNAITTISQPLLTDSMMNKGILTNLLSVNEKVLPHVLGEYENIVRKFHLFNATFEKNSLYSKTKHDSASTAGEARIKYVENTNVIFHALFGNPKDTLLKNRQIITFTL